MKICIKLFSPKCIPNMTNKTVPRVLLDTKDCIQAFPEQQPVRIREVYLNEDRLSEAHRRELEYNFPDKIITKKQVVKLFSDDSTTKTGILACLIWGGINPYLRGKSLSHYQEFLTYFSTSLDDSVTHLKSDFMEGRYRDAYKRFYDGAYKILYVGPSFYTKIFYFLGQSMPELNVKPLIFDKYTKLAYYSLLKVMYSELPSIERYDLFKHMEFKEKNRDVKISTKLLPEVYEAFVFDMNEWSQEIGVTPTRLEEYLFGYPLNRKKGIVCNPRKDMLEIARG